jgi:hypothetical protein
MSTSFSNLKVDAKPFYPSRITNPEETMRNQFSQWGFQTKDQKVVDGVLTVWFTASTLETILTKWENIIPKEIHKEQVPVNNLCYNVQG